MGLERGETTKSAYKQEKTFSPISIHFSKVPINRRNCVSPISRHFLSFLLFLDTFSLILDTKVSRNGNDPKSVTDAGPEQPFRCLDWLQQLPFVAETGLCPPKINLSPLPDHLSPSPTISFSYL